jgi:DNA gyrase subunit A
MFATTGGNVRRNKLSDFVDVRRSGIIAMKLDEDEAIVDVQICTERDDVLLTAAGGQCIRFPVTDVRVFTGRTSMGVRGIALPEGDKLISLSILRHVEATSDERSAYLKMRRAVAGETASEETVDAEGEETSGAIQLSSERYVEMSAHEQVVLTVSVNGFGKRTSSFEYRTTGRGGKGIVAMSVNNRNGKLVASFPVEDRHPDRRPLDPGRHRIRYRRRRACGVGRAYRRGRRERKWQRRVEVALMVRRRTCAVSNHEIVRSSFETRAKKRAPQDKV